MRSWSLGVLLVVGVASLLKRVSSSTLVRFNSLLGWRDFFVLKIDRSFLVREGMTKERRGTWPSLAGGGSINWWLRGRSSHFTNNLSEILTNKGSHHIMIRDVKGCRDLSRKLNKLEFFANFNFPTNFRASYFTCWRSIHISFNNTTEKWRAYPFEVHSTLPVSDRLFSLFRVFLWWKQPPFWGKSNLGFLCLAFLICTRAIYISFDVKFQVV